MDFRDYLRTKIIKNKDRILEFGPLVRPLFTKQQNPKIFFADVKSTDDIKKLYTSNDYLKSTGIIVDVDSIVDIDYVIKGDYKNTFKNIEKFDVVVLSHVVEHMPDILYFFDDILNVLKKDGKLVIIYPDAKYCFDHFRNGTSFIDAYDVYKNKKANYNGVFDFTYNVVHENDPSFFWNNMNVADKLPKNEFNKAISAYENAINGIMPDDVHFWPFSDHQFVKFLYDMDRAGLLKLKIDEFYRTQQNTQEFMIILSRKNNKDIQYDKYKEVLNLTNPNSSIAGLLNKNAVQEAEILDINKKYFAIKEEAERLKKDLLDI